VSFVPPQPIQDDAIWKPLSREIVQHPANRTARLISVRYTPALGRRRFFVSALALL
jgi:hypothetical protein